MDKKAEEIQEMRKGKFSWRLLGENFVFEEDGHFYKMPTYLAKNTMYRDCSSYEKVNTSLETIRKYFGPIAFIPETKIYEDSEGHFVIDQVKVEGGKELTRDMMDNNPELLSRFKRLVIANEVMWQNEGVFLDLLGSDIVTHPQTIHNLITDGKDLYVFDFGLLEKKPKNILFRVISHSIKLFQSAFVKIFY
ncbi:hypothetical protein GW846_03650 [Candidatus Gracilibacteria bacterium]|nr:hypothetical protein [Candidatus Gracilibacteria bacterium]